MRPVSTPTPSIAPIEASFTYAINTGVKPVNETFAGGDMRRARTGAFAQHRMAVANGRLSTDLGLDTSGFLRVDHPTQVSDFHDPAQIRDIYLPEIERLVAGQSGARRVVIFDHTLRSGDAGERESRHLREPVLSVHNDYTEWSGPQRVREVLPDEADALLAGRFAIIQVWRSIAGPIEANPLGMLDARTVASADLLSAERRYPNRIGETYQVTFNPAHAWVYFPRLRRDEAIVFKVYDSARDGRARFTPHSSFVDPTTPAGAPPRQSIEVRALAFF
jgi:hypothetical protein